MILEVLYFYGINILKLNVVCGCGGLFCLIEGGMYIVNDVMLEDLKNGFSGYYVLNFGGILVYEIVFGLNIFVFIVDFVVVDEMELVVCISGIVGMECKSIFYVLN